LRPALAARPPESVEVTGLSHDGRGIARIDGKTAFVPGALPGELVTVERRNRRGSYDEATLLSVERASPERVAPRCSAYGTCGGCALQHASSALQRSAKHQALVDELARIGKVTPREWLEPLVGPEFNYRRRARLGVKYVAKKGRVLVGFRERAAPYVADVRVCEVLAPPVATLIEPLAELIGGLSIRERIPQVEVAVGDAATALVFRNLEAPSAADRDALLAFGRAHDVDVWLQPGGLATAAPLGPQRPLSYRIADGDVTLEFQPLDFIQVNGILNGRMITQALDWLGAGPADAVLDLYCGLGNFTLPIARRAGSVHGVEGEAGLIERARANARANGIANAEFSVADLARDCRDLPFARGRYQRVLLDPPRVGAREMLPLIAALGPARVVYISCHPGSLARDAGLLVHEHGFHLRAAGIMDMFPHTAHVESMAVFERD
jgi:23S rRNA (uracil1939-C5)-methyltransferase